MMNILTIDFEDWYQDLPLKQWDNYQARIVKNSEKLLSIFDETNTYATFFVVAYNAQRFPELIEKIKNKGHEIGVHGYSHTNLLNQNPIEFKEDLRKSINILEKICNEKIVSYRAPYFSITKKTSWAINILKRNQIKYDSSIFPVKTCLYGVPNAPRFPFRVSSFEINIDDEGEDFLEFPVSTYKIPTLKINIPIGGGFYLRFFPYGFIKHAIRRIHEENQPAIFYFHPWELDFTQPQIRLNNPLSGWCHNYNLKNAEAVFKKLLKDFKFTSIEKFLNK